MAETLTVSLRERSYPIALGRGLEADVRAEVDRRVRAGGRVVVLTDGNVAARQREKLAAMFGEAPRLAIEAGEAAKSVTSWGGVLEFLAASRVDRTGALFAVGGGVVGDLGGFAAASYLRGIDFIQVPTTLLAMVDSSVGGKTGINLQAGKNLAGAFHQPRGVFIDTEFLASLPAREFAAGMAEVIKYGLLGDAELLAQLERVPLAATSPSLADIIRRCCALKARIVEGDERELASENGRALLNLGHTFGHAIEQVAGYGTYLHGEAVAIGLVAAARLSHELGYLSASDEARISLVVAAHGLPVKLRVPLAVKSLMATLAQDKKSRAGVPRFVVLKRLGEAVTQSQGITIPIIVGCFLAVGAKDSL